MIGLTLVETITLYQSPALALIPLGKSSGLVIDFGYNHVSVCPVYQHTVLSIFQQNMYLGVVTDSKSLYNSESPVLDHHSEENLPKLILNCIIKVISRNDSVQLISDEV